MDSSIVNRRWLVSEESFDEAQQDIKNLKQGNYLISGCAGSGKTVLALQRAYEIKQAELGSYLIVIFTHTLKDFMRGGIAQLGLDPNRVCNFDQLAKLGHTQADYIIVDEVQDFEDIRIKTLMNMANKNFIFFGDDAQQIHSRRNRGTSLNHIAELSKIKEDNIKVLSKNYRLPKSIAEFAIEVCTRGYNWDFLGQCQKSGGSKPIVRQHSCYENELEDIKDRIEENGFLDIGILVKRNSDVEKVKNYYESIGYDVEYKYYENGDNDNNKLINNLNFNTSKPKVMTYHSSKGLQFENVFLPICDIDCNDYDYRDALYVAITRASEELYITYSGSLSPYISSVDSSLYQKF